VRNERKMGPMLNASAAAPGWVLSVEPAALMGLRMTRRICHSRRSSQVHAGVVYLSADYCAPSGWMVRVRTEHPFALASGCGGDDLDVAADRAFEAFGLGYDAASGRYLRAGAPVEFVLAKGSEWLAEVLLGRV
jgi:hypothetical protein